MKSRKSTDILVCILTFMLVFTGGLSGCGAADKQDKSDTGEKSRVVSSNDKADSAGMQKKDKTLTDRSGSVIRIACWQKEPYMINLKAYLADKFPEYTIKYEYIQRDNYESVIDSQLSYNGAADIIYVTQKMTVKYAKAGYLAPLTDVGSLYTEEARNAFKYINNIYAVPLVSSYECFYYNQDLFEKYGLVMPTSYDQFLSTCTYVDKFRPGRAIASGLKDGEHLSNCALALLQGGYFSTSRGKALGARIKYGRASFYKDLYPYLRDWEKMIDYGILSPDMYLMDKEAAVKEFAEGRSVFLVGGPEDYNYIKELNPKINMGTMPFGSSSGDMPVIIGGCQSGIAVNRYGKHESEAKEVAVALASYDGQKALWRDSPGSKTYLKGIDFGMPEEFDEIRDILANNMYDPSKCWGEYSREVSVIFGQELQQVLLKKETLEQALIKIDKKILALTEEG